MKYDQDHDRNYLVKNFFVCGALFRCHCYNFSFFFPIDVLLLTVNLVENRIADSET